ncbi:MAG TPA: hypothetical protein VMY99_00735 [Nevskiaceae bacterium]|nr:hypothetical protein [Nevskiaceae bacterium]
MSTSADWRERVHFFDQTIDELRTNLVHHPLLLRTLSHLAILDRLDSIYLANTLNGRIVIPGKYRDTESLPVAIIRPGENAQATGDFASQTPKQRENSGKWLSLIYKVQDPPVHEMMADVPCSFQGATDAAVKASPRPGLNLSMEPTMGGSMNHTVTTCTLNPDFFAPVEQTHTIKVAQRPIVALLMDPDNPHNLAKAPATLLHEVVHVKNAETYPLQPANPTTMQQNNALNEYEARTTAGLYEIDLHSAGHPTYADPNVGRMENWAVAYHTRQALDRLPPEEHADALIGLLNTIQNQ